MAVQIFASDSCSDVLQEIIKKLGEKYFYTFKKEPVFYARCPGRINLIGEHVDYSKFAVFPMAIESDVIIAFGSNDEEGLDICNYDDKYPRIVLPYDSVDQDEADFMNLEWYHYVIAGLKIIVKEYGIEETPKFNMMIYGRIPVAAGLSSSSALVCASALATVYHYGLHKRGDVGKKQLANLCAIGETYVGTKGGGMDQAIIFCAEEGFATKIEFAPELNAQNISLPKELAFVVADSGVRARKAASNKFNKRVAECLLSAKVVGKIAGVDWKTISNLGDLVRSMGKTPSEIMLFSDDALEQDSFSGQEICNILEINLEQLEEILRGFQLQNLEVEEFKLFKRLLHVMEENDRVDQFINCCASEDLRELGIIMSKSHDSLQINYECSHPRLDRLVNCARQNGALGARLTGAGWGGCIIAAVLKKDECRVVEALRSCVEEEFGEPAKSVFSVKPGDGAFIIEV